MDGDQVSLLVGNGLDIQIGGDDFQNKWIMVRLLAKAKTGEYDVLFTDEKTGIPIIVGDEIVELFRNLVPYANKAIYNDYDDKAERYGDADLVAALKDFKGNHKIEVRSIEEIGMEDWLLIFLLFLIDERDILNQYKNIKLGFERMILDSIYCESYIQKLYSMLDKSSIRYFSEYDKIFTLNYDNTIEKLLKKNIFHLHGDFNTVNPSENVENALGYIRILKKENVSFPTEYIHCNCTGISDFSGNRKYKYASDMTKAFIAFENLKSDIKTSKIKIEDILTKVPDDQLELVKIGIEKDLKVGHNYFFNEFETLSGTLEIVGLAPQNDSHIFECINKSSVDAVIFYHYFGNRTEEEAEEEIETMSIPINKKYTIKNVKTIWDKIKITKPANASNSISKEQLDILNALCFTSKITKDDIIWQLNSVPKFTRNAIVEMMKHEMEKNKYHQTPQNEQVFAQNFKDFSSTLEISALSPQALLYLYIDSTKPNVKLSKKKK
ncbi:MAG: hypothetical protein ACERKZ_00720 [Lachnotalea sp.]